MEKIRKTRNENKTSTFDPNQGAHRQTIIEGQQLFTRQVEAAGGGWTIQSHFIADAVNVDIATVTIDISSLVQSRFETFEPEDPMRNRRLRMPVPDKPFQLPSRKNRPNRLSPANFCGDAMQAERGLFGPHHLAAAIA